MDSRINPRRRTVTLEFDTGELRNIADLLGPNDLGAKEMLELADELDSLD